MRIRRKARRGAALVWFALVAVVVIGMAGLALDAGYLYWVAHDLQNAADAAALAGAQKVVQDVQGAWQAAMDIALVNKAAGRPVQLAANGGNDSAGDIVIGHFDSTSRVFTPTLTSPNAVKVTARLTGNSPNGPVALNFGPAFGVTSIGLTRSAIAISAGGTGAGLIILDGSAPAAFSVLGNASIAVSNGAIQVNSDSSTAVRWTGNVNVSATELDVVGDISMTGNGGFDGPVHTGVPMAGDPLAQLPAPTWNPASDQGTISLPSGNQTRNLQPGYYSGGISAGGNTVLNLAPGIYILGGAGLNLIGNAIFTARGVMIYLTGTGGVQMTGNGAVVITPPDPSLYSYAGVDTYAGVAIFQARTDTAADKFTGNDNLNIQGTIYLSAAAVTLVGNATSLGNQVIVDTLPLTGNGSIGIDYDGRNATGGLRSWLVQ